MAISNINTNPITTAMNKANLSIERVAEIMGVSRQTVNNYINSPNTIPFDNLMKLSSATGISLDALCQNTTKMQTGPQFKKTYTKKVKNLNKYLKKAQKAHDSLEHIDIGNSAVCLEKKASLLEELEEIIDASVIKARKPLLCAFGPSDTGKSTFLNYLLGDDIIPADYSPLTSIPTYILHVSDKPDYLTENADNAIVFGRKNPDSETIRFKDSIYNLYDSEHRIRTGNYASILKDFGTHGGEYSEETSFEIDEIVIFVDAPILKEFVLLDIPGFRSGYCKDDIGLTMDMAKIDVLFYLSTLDAFLRGEEISAINTILRTRSDLSSMYFLGTHPISIGNQEKIEQIICSGSGRLVDAMSDAEVKRLYEAETKRLNVNLSLEDLVVKRWFVFDCCQEIYCKPLNETLTKELPDLISQKLSNATLLLKDTCRNYACKHKGLYDKCIEDTGRQPISKEEVASKKIKSHKDLELIKERLNKKIGTLSAASSDEIKSRYANTICEDFIVSAIDRKGFKNKKSDMESLANYLSNELNDILQDVLNDKSKIFSDSLNKELEDYSDSLNIDIKAVNINAVINHADILKAFATGLAAGGAAFGALAFWASSVAAGSNLGAYILIAKVVSVLSGLGISLGGTATVSAFVASIGGPVTLGIALALIVAIAAFGIFTGTWKTRLAKKIVKAYEEEKVLSQCLDCSNKYWDATTETLDKCIKTLEDFVFLQYDQEQIMSEIDHEVYMEILTHNKMLLKFMYDTYSEMFHILEENDDDDDND